jgi:hypothetical protein
MKASATKSIKKNEELLLNYGEQYVDNCGEMREIL